MVWNSIYLEGRPGIIEKLYHDHIIGKIDKDKIFHVSLEKMVSPSEILEIMDEPWMNNDEKIKAIQELIKK